MRPEAMSVPLREAAPLKKLVVAGSIGMYALAIAWLLVDIATRGSIEIWGPVGILLLGIAIFLYVRPEKNDNPRVADIHFAGGFGALILGSAMIAFSGFGARGVT